MANKHFLQIEYSVTLLVIFSIILFFMPISVKNTAQARFISKWNERLNRVEYMFSVINTHISDELVVSFENTKSSLEKERLLLTLIKPYLRIDMENRPPKRYKPKYMNKTRVAKSDRYYFEDFYYAEKNTIIGIKDVRIIGQNKPFFIMMFDMNGILPPNRWGNDVFGVEIYDDGVIKSFGSDMDLNALREDCSSEGTGVSCSYYYKIGGGFDD